MSNLLYLVAAALPPAGVTPNFANPQDVSYIINAISGFMTICIVAPFVLLRLYNTSIRDPDVRHGRLVLFVRMVGMHGGGFHEYEITKADRQGFEQALYADSIVYGSTAWFTKSTLLLIFARVFAPFKKTVIGIYIFIAAMLGYYFPVMILKIKICTPIEGFWDDTVAASCLDQSALFMCDTVMSAATDLAVLILPIPLVWSLHMPMKKKVKIGILLGAGGIATLASIVRLILVFQTNSFSDQTISFVRFNLLGVAEIGIGLICASFPAFNAIASRFFPDSTFKSKQTPPNSNQVRLERLRKSRGQRKMPKDSLLQSRASYVEADSSNQGKFITQEQEFNKETVVHGCSCHDVSSDMSQYRTVKKPFDEGPWAWSSEMENGREEEITVTETWHSVDEY